MQDISTMDKEGTRVRVVNDGETVTVTSQRMMDDDETMVEFQTKDLLGSTLTTAMLQRVEALGVAREVLTESGSSNLFTTKASGKIAGIIPEALIDLADYITTGMPAACERQTRAMDRLEEDAKKWRTVDEMPQ